VPSDPAVFLIIALVIVVGVAVIELVQAIEPFNWDDGDDDRPIY
jgi:hypothetical protein